MRGRNAIVGRSAAEAARGADNLWHARRTHLSGRCSPESRISRTRSRYWYSSCRLAAEALPLLAGATAGPGPSFDGAICTISEGLVGLAV